MAAGGGRNNADQNPDSEATGIIAVLVIALLMVGSWFAAKPVFIYAAFSLILPQLKALDLLGTLGPIGKESLLDVMATFKGQIDPWSIPWAVFWDLKVNVGERMKFVFVAGIAALTIMTIYRMKGDGFATTMKLGDFIKFQSNAWPTTTFSSIFNPDKAPAHLAPARTPGLWIREIKAWRKKEGMTPGGLNIDVVTRAFEDQLGAPWRGLEPSHPIHIKALVVVFGLHMMRRSDYMEVVGKGLNAHKIPISLRLRGDLNRLYSAHFNDPKSKEVEAAVEALIAPYMTDKRMMGATERVMKDFAYVNTALSHLLAYARMRQGVLATAEFTWLKNIDRTLWYGLNNTGRRAYLTEGAGIIAHYQAERVTGHALVEPHVAEAVEGVKNYFEEQGIDQLDDIEDLFKVIED